MSQSTHDRGNFRNERVGDLLCRIVYVVIEGSTRPCVSVKHVYHKTRDEAELTVEIRSSDPQSDMDNFVFCMNEECWPMVSDWRHATPEELYAVALSKVRS